jgi:hypothetical protein
MNSSRRRLVPEALTVQQIHSMGLALHGCEMASNGVRGA